MAITHNAIADLHKGCASLSFLASTSSGVGNFFNLDFSSADLLYSLKDSFQLSADDDTKQETYVDQLNELIDSFVTEEGKSTISLNFPTIAAEVLNTFFQTAGSASTTATVKGPGDTSAHYTAGQGYLNGSKEVEVTLMAESASRKTAIIWARVKFTAKMVMDSSDTPLYIQMDGTVLSNPSSSRSSVGDYAVVRVPAA